MKTNNHAITEAGKPEGPYSVRLRRTGRYTHGSIACPPAPRLAFVPLLRFILGAPFLDLREAPLETFWEYAAAAVPRTSVTVYTSACGGDVENNLLLTPRPPKGK